MWRGYTYSENNGMYYCSSKSAIGCTAQYLLIPTRKGKHLVMYRGYTYSETHGTYYCSSKTSIGCTARIKLTKNGGIQIISEEHSHSPPNYIKTTNGNYIRV
ncbi:Modifier of mdg4 [Operophtera brumata]|uniref:Modifier of mdg4 n=1 Tax=Operophtera brumata TaxID=104452 RepID=A0A0L7LNM6_OPEBR|nr:Modifier of mdg4 [Operophtera brumata]